MTRNPVREWRVRWFHRWDGVLDGAVRALPEHPQWPNDLLRVMFDAPSRVPKKVALLLDRGGVPKALIGLRLRGRGTWEPLSTYIVPGFLIIGPQELTAAILTRLSVNLRVAWWRMPTDPPLAALRGIRSFDAVPTHILDLDADPEIYWRKSHFLDTSRQARRKSAHFRFVVNPPGGLQWTLCNAEQKWRSEPFSQAPDLADRLAADQFLQQRGQHFTLALFDGDQLIAAEACVPDRGDLVSLVCFMRPEYRSYMVGHAVAIRICEWARQSGFHGYDIGGGNYSYKARFAPARSQKTVILMCPELQHRFRQVMTHAERVRDTFDRNLPRRSFHWLQRGIRNRLLGSTAGAS